MARDRADQSISRLLASVRRSLLAQKARRAGRVMTSIIQAWSNRETLTPSMKRAAGSLKNREFRAQERG